MAPTPHVIKYTIPMRRIIPSISITFCKSHDRLDEPYSNRSGTTSTSTPFISPTLKLAVLISNVLFSLAPAPFRTRSSFGCWRLSLTLGLRRYSCFDLYSTDIPHTETAQPYAYFSYVPSVFACSALYIEHCYSWTIYATHAEDNMFLGTLSGQISFGDSLGGTQNE